MPLDDRKIVLSPEAVEALPEFALLNAQQKTFLLLLAAGSGVVAATQGAYQCKDLRSAKCFAYELMRRRSLQPVLNKIFGEMDDQSVFLKRVDALVRRGHRVTDAEFNSVVLYGAVNKFLPPDYSPNLVGSDFHEAKRAFEIGYFKQKLEDHQWNMTTTAAALGLERSHLYKKLKVLGIQRPVAENVK
jgi:Bacterial regulatory protein, Fis family